MCKFFGQFLQHTIQPIIYTRNNCLYFSEINLRCYILQNNYKSQNIKTYDMLCVSLQQGHVEMAHSVLIKYRVFHLSVLEKAALLLYEFQAKV